MIAFNNSAVLKNTSYYSRRSRQERISELWILEDPKKHSIKPPSGADVLFGESEADILDTINTRLNCPAGMARANIEKGAYDAGRHWYGDAPIIKVYNEPFFSEKQAVTSEAYKEILKSRPGEELRFPELFASDADKDEWLPDNSENLKKWIVDSSFVVREVAGENHVASYNPEVALRILKRLMKRQEPGYIKPVRRNYQCDIQTAVKDISHSIQVVMQTAWDAHPAGKGDRREGPFYRRDRIIDWKGVWDCNSAAWVIQTWKHWCRHLLGMKTWYGLRKVEGYREAIYKLATDTKLQVCGGRGISSGQYRDGMSAEDWAWFLKFVLSEHRCLVRMHGVKYGEIKNNEKSA